MNPPEPKPAADPKSTIAGQLAAHLDNELAAHRGLVGLAEARLKAAVTADHRALADIAAREDPLIADVQRLRSLRERIIRAAAAICAVTGEVTLSAIARTVPSALGEALTAKGRDLRTLLERLKRLEDHIAAILRHGMSLVRDLLDAVSGVERPARAAYDRRGLAASAGPVVRGSLLDMKC